MAWRARAAGGDSADSAGEVEWGRSRVMRWARSLTKRDVGALVALKASLVAGAVALDRRYDLFTARR